MKKVDGKTELLKNQEPEEVEKNTDLKLACEHVGQIVAEFLLDLLGDLTVEVQGRTPEQQNSMYTRFEKYSEGLKK